MIPVNSDETEVYSEIDRLNRLAYESIKKEDLESAKGVLETVRNLLQQKENKQDRFLRCKVDYLVNMGAAYQYGDPKALRYLLESFAILETIDYPLGLMDTLHGLSWAYFIFGDYVKAKQYVEQGLLVGETQQDGYRIYQMRNSAGAILNETNEPERALHYLEQNVQYVKSQEDDARRSVAYNNLAMVLAEQGDYARAEEAGLISLNYCRQENLPITEAFVLDTLGRVYLGKGDLDKSIHYFREAINAFRVNGSSGQDFEPNLNLGEALILKGALDEAEENLLYVLKMTKNMQGSRLDYACYEKLANLYELKGNYQQAITYYRNFHLEKERVFSQQKIQQINNLNYAHKVETALKDAKILELTNASLRQEIELQKREHAELERQATRDPLTGLMNRRHFYTLGHFEFENARKNGFPLSVVMMDVDYFKSVNDQFGHLIGDQVLVRITEAINSAVRAEDLVCRYGGEEFVLLVPHLGEEKTLVIANRVRKAVEKLSFPLEDEMINITISAGVASLADCDQTLEALIDRADHILLKAKTSGRNTVLPLTSDCSK